MRRARQPDTASRPQEEGPRAGTGASQHREWLILVYRVPPTPTRLRAMVWRRLRDIGAIYLQHGVAATPRSVSTLEALEALGHEIAGVGGSSSLFCGSTIAGEHDVTRWYNTARSGEYSALAESARDLRELIETHGCEPPAAPPDRRPERVKLARLAKRFDAVVRRDVLGSTGRDQARAELDRCRELTSRTEPA